MKPILLLVAFVLATMCVKAQAALVNDPAANKSLAISVAQGAQQVESGLAQLEYLKQAKESVSKVSKILYSVKEIEETYEIQQQIIDKSINYLQTLEKTNLLSPQEMVNAAGNYNSLIDKSIKILGSLDKILSDGLFEMSDAERLSFIKEINQEMRNKRVDTKLLYNRYLQVVKTRALNKMFKRSN